MTSRKLRLDRASMLALSLALAACGGGSTSNGGGPVITPGPAPTPTPSPTPAPTPTPTPVGTLEDTHLTSYAANATVMDAAFPDDGSGAIGGSAQDAALEVQLISTNYTLSYGGSSIQFDTNDIIRSSQSLYVFQLVDGDTTDTIYTYPLASLTSADGPYRYTNAGYWTRSIAGTDRRDDRSIAFAVGVDTPLVDLPRTGSAGYYIDITGNIAFDGQPDPFGIVGRGSLVADFASGALTLQGGLQLRKPDYFNLASPYVYSMRLDGAGTLSSNANSFAGSLTMRGLADLDGMFDGRFFGPDALEVGGTFYANGADATAVGAFLGIQDSRIPTRPTLAGLTNTTDMAGALNVQGYGLGEPGTAQLVDQRFTNFQAVVSFNPSTQSYTLKALPGFFDYYGDGAISVGPGQRAAVQDQPGFALYEIGAGTQVAIFEGDVAGVPLTYTSFAAVTSTRSALTDGVGGYVAMVPFGLRTLPGQMPITGSANYSGVIYGVANDTGRTTDFQSRLSHTLGGTSQFAVDFSTFTLTGTLNPIGTSIADGTTLDFGVYSVEGAIENLQHLVNGRINGGALGDFQGMFFGPNAEEFAGIFSMFAPGNEYQLTGITVARQD